MLNKFSKNESGQSIVLVALMFTVLLGFGALAVDVGYMALQRSSMQNAADSAALAGAVMIPKVYEHDYNETYENSVKQKMIDDYAKKNFNKINGADLAIDDINIDTTSKTVDITITHTTPKFLGGILSDEVKVMTVYAKAEYESEWNGEALPFLNLSDTYLNADGSLKTTPLSIWGKEGPGEFEVINRNEIPTPVNDAITLRWQDGLLIANGQLGDLHKIVEETCIKDRIFYVFSLKNEVIKNRITLEGNKYYYTNNAGVKTEINNTPNIDEQDLTLLKIKLTQDCITPGNGTEDRVYFKVLDNYNVYEGELPEDYMSEIAETSSKLIQ